ncbi:site-specific integrase [Tellurirhabdus bombi]|uniref:site-specific integrase n=1 Tax=Tellurirhabdus bombi TaxID=2907205 RepID=UPI002107AF3E|nr:site-specific integrase [Tellurirhabdus bombi]
MSNVTLKIILNSKPREDGEFLVMLRITYCRKHAYAGTDVYVREKLFNDKGSADKFNWIRTGHPQSGLLNSLIRARFEKAQRVIREIRESEAYFSVKDIKNRLENNAGDSFIQFIQKRIGEYVANKKLGTADCHQIALNKLLVFIAPKDDLLFGEVTTELVDGYKAFMFNDGLKASTVREYLLKLRTNLIKYISAKKLPENKNPMLGYELPKEATVQVERLTTYELERIMEVQLPRNQEEHFRNAYIAEYFLHGMRSGDLIQMRVNQLQRDHVMLEGKVSVQYRIVYAMDKTDKPKSVLVPAQIQPMLLAYADGKNPDDFLFPFLRTQDASLSEVELRKRLKGIVSYGSKVIRRVAKKAGVEKYLKLHTSRHSFANHLYEVTGDIRLVQMSLGHSTVSTTERYMSRFSQSVVDRANTIYGRIRVADGPAETILKHFSEKDEKNPFVDNSEKVSIVAV